METGFNRQRMIDFESCAAKQVDNAGSRPGRATHEVVAQSCGMLRKLPSNNDVASQDTTFNSWRDIANCTDPSMSTSTAAEMLGMHRITFIRLVRSGKGPLCRKAFGDSGSTIIRLSDFLEWVRKTGRAGRLVSPHVLDVKSVQQPAHVRGVVYFIGNDAGAVKIGVTRRPVAERLTQLQTSNSRVLRCIAVIPAGREMFRIERDAHEFFAASRLNGEWFMISSEEAASYAIARGGREWL